MYSEKTQRNKSSITSIFALIVLVYIITNIVNKIALERYRFFFEVGNLILVCIIAAYVMRYKIMDFEYILKDDILYIKRIIGVREYAVLELDLIDIKKFSCKRDEVKNYNIKKKYNYRAKINSKNSIYCIYSKDNMYYMFSFEPSKKLIELIRKSINKEK